MALCSHFAGTYFYEFHNLKENAGIFANFSFLRKFLIKSKKLQTKGKEKSRELVNFVAVYYASLREEYDKTKLNTQALNIQAFLLKY